MVGSACTRVADQPPLLEEQVETGRSKLESIVGH